MATGARSSASKSEQDARLVARAKRALHAALGQGTIAQALRGRLPGLVRVPHLDPDRIWNAPYSSELDLVERCWGHLEAEAIHNHDF